MFPVSERVPEKSARSWRRLTERLAVERDPDIHANLAIVARHVDAEARGDIEAALATLAPEPVYAFFGRPGLTELRGRDAIRQLYRASTAAGQNRMEFELCRVVADRGCVVTEGIIRQAARVQTPDRWYVTEYPAIIVWVIDPDGRVAGERVYFGGPPVARRALAPGECPHLGPLNRDGEEVRG
jgi:limonene-1,2-epoxide hydrolase